MNHEEQIHHLHTECDRLTDLPERAAVLRL